MFVISRGVGETISIGDNIRITIVAILGDEVHLSVTAPEQATVERQEIHAKRPIFPSDQTD